MNETLAVSMYRTKLVAINLRTDNNFLNANVLHVGEGMVKERFVKMSCKLKMCTEKGIN